MRENIGDKYNLYRLVDNSTKLKVEGGNIDGDREAYLWTPAQIQPKKEGEYAGTDE